MRNLSRHIRPSKEMEALVRDSVRDLPLRRIGVLVCETCHFLARCDELLNGIKIASGSSKSLSNIIETGIAIDQDFETWSKELPETFRYRTMSAPSCSLENTLEQSPTPAIQTFSSTAVASVWDMHRVARIFLLSNLMKCTSASEMDCPQEEFPTKFQSYSLQATGKIKRLADDICASVPYILGEVEQDGRIRQSLHLKAIGGFYLLFPLKVLLYKQILDPVQEAWILKRLTYIKNFTGIQEAAPLSDRPSAAAVQNMQYRNLATRSS